LYFKKRSTFVQWHPSDSEMVRPEGFISIKNILVRQKLKTHLFRQSYPDIVL